MALARPYSLYFWVWSTYVTGYMKRRRSARYMYAFMRRQFNTVRKKEPVGHLEVYRLTPYSLGRTDSVEGQSQTACEAGYPFALWRGRSKAVPCVDRVL